MTTHTIRGKLLFSLSIVVSFVLTAFFLSTTITHAQTVSTCSQPNVGNFVPYIYNGELHSFDYTVFDNDRGVVLPLQTRIDNKDVETRYSSEWTSNGDTRVHVDVPSWEGFNGTFPVTVHVKTGPDASCETQATFTVSLPKLPPQASGTVTNTPDYGTGGPVSQTESEAPGASDEQTVTETNTTPSIEVSIDDNIIMQEGESATEDTIGEAASETEVTQTADTEREGGFLSIFAPVTPEGSICTTLPLISWILLAVLHLIIAGAILFFLRSLISESNLWFTVALLVPFIGFLLAWFLLDGCRMHQWFPVVVALISLGTVLGVPASDDEPKKVVASTIDTSGGPVMKVSETSEKEGGSKERTEKEKVIRF